MLQVTAAGKYTSAVVSDMWTVPNLAPPSVTRIGTYQTAAYLFSKETVSTLVQLFRLPPEWLQKTKQEIIFKGTGWHILRSEASQGNSEVLTYAPASEMNRAQLVAVHQRHLKLKRPSKKNMDDLLSDLFPDEAREHDEAAVAEREGTRRKRTREKGARNQCLQRGGIHTYIRSLFNSKSLRFCLGPWAAHCSR